MKTRTIDSILKKVLACKSKSSLPSQIRLLMRCAEEEDRHEDEGEADREGKTEHDGEGERAPRRVRRGERDHADHGRHGREKNRSM